MRWISDRGITATVVALAAAPLFFYGLGAQPLWQDEAHTALLGRHTLRWGLPYVGTGAESASALAGKDAGWGGVFLHIPPMQSYLAALSFGLFGESAWAARLPFALCGWLCVLLLPWALGGRVDRVTAIWSQLVLATHVPFLLHMRQCRYYAPAAVLSLVAFGLARRLVERRDGVGTNRRMALALAATLVALTLTYEFAWAAAAATVAFACGWSTLRSRSLRPAIGCGTAVAVSSLAAAGWLWLASSAPSRQAGPGTNVNPHFPQFPWYYLGVLNGYGVPLLWLLFLCLPLGVAATLRSRWRGGRETVDQQLALWELVVLGFMQTLVLSVVCTYTRNGFPRYIVPAFPAAVAAAVALVRLAGSLAQRSTAWQQLVTAGACLVMASGQWSFRASTVASFWPWEQWLEAHTGVTWSRRNDVHLLSYLRELQKPPQGPVAACLRFLNQAARPGETLVAEYSEKPLKFHTPLAVYGGETGAYPDRPPDWIWVRPFLRLWGEVAQTRSWLTANVDLSQYDRIVLRGVYDSLWENRPHPEWHVFSDEYRAIFPHTRPMLILYRRRPEP